MTRISPPENRRILIVDDEPETLKGYAEFLQPASTAPARRSSRREAGAAGESTTATENYELLLAPSGEKALELMQASLASEQTIAAGFFDVKLEGGMDGLETIQAIRKLDPRIHCVVVTAYQDRSVEEIHRLFGEEFKDQWDYLNKPFTQGEITQKARQMVSAWNRKRQLEWMNAQLIRSERMAAVGQVARGVGHEFGNILLRIMGKADLALMEKDPAKIQEHLKVVLAASERAGVIVRNLQSFSKTEPSLQSAPLTQPLETSLSLVNHELTKASIKVVRDFKETAELRIDTGALGQVFLNLFINAIHAMPKGGTLTLSLEAAKNPQGREGVRAIIQDTGTGIPAEVLPRIFETAFTTKGDQGSGLGLSVSKDILEAHGGTIEALSPPGKGAQFILWLPRSSA